MILVSRRLNCVVKECCYEDVGQCSTEFTRKAYSLVTVSNKFVKSSFAVTAAAYSPSQAGASRIVIPVGCPLPRSRFHRAAIPFKRDLCPSLLSGYETFCSRTGTKGSAMGALTEGWWLPSTLECPWPAPQGCNRPGTERRRSLRTVE